MYSSKRENRSKIKKKGASKNYRPPHPMGVKGGCSPQNNRKSFEASKRASGQWQQFYVKKFSCGLALR